MGKREIARKFDEIIGFAELEKFIDTPVKHYSSGMYVRLAFCLAAHLEPEILLVDEVLAVGDIRFQKKCLGKMGDVAAGLGRTVILVTHQLNQIRRLCHRVVWLDGGELRRTGPTAEVVSAYEENMTSSGVEDVRPVEGAAQFFCAGTSSAKTEPLSTSCLLTVRPRLVFCCAWGNLCAVFIMGSPSMTRIGICCRQMPWME